MEEVVGMKSQNKSKMNSTSKRTDEALFGSKLLSMIKSSLGLTHARAEVDSPGHSTIADAEDSRARVERARIEAETALRMVQTSL